MAARPEVVKLNKVLPRVEAPSDYGLSGRQAAERLENGYANTKPVSAEKTVAKILKDNIFTYLNLVLVTLGLCLIAVGSYANLTFIPIIVINTIIGIIQELRSKRMLSKLSFVTAPNAVVIRDGVKQTIRTCDAVLDDIAVFTGDTQIYADAIVLSGECQVNEALVTGESDEITKTAGDVLLSGSFIVSGACLARLDKVGRDSFVSKLTLEAKKTKGNLSSGMVSTLKRFVQVVGIMIVPIGITMFIRQVTQYDIDTVNATTSTVGALVGMIPDGLYLLVSVTLTVSVLRLAKKRTLVRERNCVETLARVNVLCVDKTGTITEPTMEVSGVSYLAQNIASKDNLQQLLADYSGNMSAENETMAAIQKFVDTPPSRRAVKTLPFSSAVKYGGVSFGHGESYLIGAPEKILLSNYRKFKTQIEEYSSQGFRVLLLAHYGNNIDAPIDASSVTPIALICLSNRIRSGAPPTFEFFAKQGVRIVVISGDNPITVSKISQEAGIQGAAQYVDAATLQTDRQLKRAVLDYNVFGRVTPDQKRRLVRALKATGNTVAMTGDGINDVLALKAANCSIAMASGSEVASQVSDIVLLDSDFSAMPAVVMEGRRVINNLERSASLFFTKNIFSLLFVLAITIPFGALFPLEPYHFTLYNAVLIGIPSFVLAMEPNKKLVKGKFLLNVFRNAIPAGITSFLALTAMFLVALRFEVPTPERSTMSLIIIAFVGFLMLYRLCQPWNTMRIALFVTMLIGFILGALTFFWLGVLPPISGTGILITVLTCIASVPVYILLLLLCRDKGIHKG